jgi:mRNA interferase MazF
LVRIGRGSLVTVPAQGDYGKPRPAVIVQSNALDETDSVLVCLCTSELRDAPIYRLTIEPSDTTGLRVPSQVIVDKIMAVRRDRCGPAIGRLDDEMTLQLNRMLALVIGIAG